ncbi:MAG: hypothetical protein ACE5I5_02305 [Candidatus Heimdallarchaeota archaeon]
MKIAVLGSRNGGCAVAFDCSTQGHHGVDTPYMSVVIRLVSLLMDRNYLSEAKRTMEYLGLSGYTAEELEKLLT